MEGGESAAFSSHLLLTPQGPRPGARKLPSSISPTLAPFSRVSLQLGCGTLFSRLSCSHTPILVPLPSPYSCPGQGGHRSGAPQGGHSPALHLPQPISLPSGPRLWGKKLEQKASTPAGPGEGGGPCRPPHPKGTLVSRLPPVPGRPVSVTLEPGC